MGWNLEIGSGSCGVGHCNFIYTPPYSAPFSNCVRRLFRLELAPLHLTCFILAIRSIHRKSEVTMADCTQKDWREICVAVTNETNSTKMTALVKN